MNIGKKCRYKRIFSLKIYKIHIQIQIPSFIGKLVKLLTFYNPNK